MIIVNLNNYFILRKVIIMIIQQEKDNIILGFKNIQSCIESISSMYQKYESKKDEIIKIIESRFSDSYIFSNIENFLARKEDLIIIKDAFLSIPTLDESINDQYKTFLQTEITRFNPDSLYLLQPHSLTNIFEFLDKQTKEQLNISPNDNNVIMWIKDIPYQYMQYIDMLLDLQCKIMIFEKIKNIHGSIVMIGANGSGKSSFARQLDGKIADNIVILSAQHLLFYNKQETISTSGNEIQKVRDFQMNKKEGGDSNFQHIITADMNNLVDALISQHTKCTYKVYEGETKQESYLKKTINIWKKLIEHRNIVIDITGLYVKGDNIKEYDFNQLSDGEKAVFYYIAHILLAPKNSYIIVDEPENHLHLTICNKLWDELEKEREDCKFIYLTHNLNFATTRSNCTIIWNKEFIPPYEWNFEILPENDTIPEILVMEIVGSRKDICFCEGNDKSSLDYKLYSILFPQYTVIPAAGHRNVIDYVNVYNTKDFFLNRAVGIIDGDYHLSEQIDKWKNQKIYTLPINEIENILCDEFILKKATETFCSEEDALDKYYENFWTILDEKKNILATTYINEIINNLIKGNFLHERKDIDKLIDEFKSNFSAEKIKMLYNDALDKIEKFIEEKDYDGAIRFVNFKGCLIRELARKNIVDKYDNRILDLIKKDFELQTYIKDTYFKDFNY